ncbi:MAG: ankyrin repeat domain-containing protein [Candidatus Dependentiae bacterium]|nr:ankyrin repeat domain-containing protein [Candidatus Dependentiae bacterium]
MNKKTMSLMVIISFIFSNTMIYPAQVEEEIKGAAAAQADQAEQPYNKTFNEIGDVIYKSYQKNKQENKQEDNQIKIFTRSLITNASKKTKPEEKKEQEEEKEDAEQLTADYNAALLKNQTNMRTLLIYNGTQEIGGGSFGMTLNAMIALFQNAGPILITGSLLSHIFNPNGNHSQVINRVQYQLYETFDARKWEIYDLESMYLLIPHDSQSKATDFNLKGYGLIANNKEKKDALIIEAEKKYPHYKELYEKGNSTSASDFIKIFRQLLTNNATDKYTNDKKWAFILTNHGEYKKSIAGLSFSEFKNFLHFLKTIETKLFIYISCYAAGFNASQVYGDLKYSFDIDYKKPAAAANGSTAADSANAKESDIQTYPFTIITGAITDAPVIVTVEKNLNYKEFINALNEKPNNYFALLSYLFPHIKDDTQTFIQNSIPQMRPANSPAWFAITDVNPANSRHKKTSLINDQVIRIGKVMASTRTQPLIIKKYMGTDQQMYEPKAILLATETIPFDIEIDSSITQVPPFISLLPGDAQHTLKRVKYPGKKLEEFDIKDIVGSLATGIKVSTEITPGYAGTKEFYIESLEFGKNEALKTINNVTIVSESMDGVFDVVLDDLYAYYYTNNDKDKTKSWLFCASCEKLIQAIAEKKDTNAIKKAINKTKDINYFTPQSNPALFVVAGQPGDKKKIAELLLQKGADVHYIDEKTGNTPLHEACRNNNPKIAYLLLRYQAKADIKNKLGQTPDPGFLLSAFADARKPQEGVEIAEILINEYGATINELLFAVAAGPVGDHDAIAQYLIKNGANINYIDEKTGNTPLHQACSEHNPKIAQLLLAHGAQVNITNKTGDTPLHLILRSTEARSAQKQQKLELIQEILNKKPDLTIKNKDGQTPEDMLEQYNYSGATPQQQKNYEDLKDLFEDFKIKEFTNSLLNNAAEKTKPEQEEKEAN